MKKLLYWIKLWKAAKKIRKEGKLVINTKNPYNDQSQKLKEFIHRLPINQTGSGKINPTIKADNSGS